MADVTTTPEEMAKPTSLHQHSKNPPMYNNFMLNYAKQYIKNVCSEWEEQKDTHLFKEHSDYDFNAVNITVYKNRVELPGEINSEINAWEDSPKTIKKLFDMKTWIKPSKRNDDMYTEYVLGFYIGTLLNKLRGKFPHFAYTYALTIADGKSPFGCTGNESHHIIQEKVPGKTLAEHIVSGTISSREFLSIIIQVGFALQKAQDKIGFVHNALYPENIIVRFDDSPTYTFFINSRVYTVQTEGITPTIIDFSSSRTAHKGFCVCYEKNPVTFNPGSDMYKLITSSLVLARGTEIFKDMSWLYEFFPDSTSTPNPIKYDSSVPYGRVFQLTNYFNIPDDCPQANINPLSFMLWIQQQRGKLYASLTTCAERPVLPKKNEKQYDKHDPKYTSPVDVRSAISKSFVYKNCSIPYNPTERETSYDTKLFSKYSKTVNSTDIRPLIICYDFPINTQYKMASGAPVYYNPERELSRIHKVSQDISAYVTHIRTAQAVGKLDTPVHSTSNLFAVKSVVKQNKRSIQAIPLYKFYKICEYISMDIHHVPSDIHSLSKDYQLIVDWIMREYPLCAEFLSQNYTLLRDSLHFTARETYYNPASLRQFYWVLMKNNKKALTLMNKIIYGYKKNNTKLLETKIINMINNGRTDVDIFYTLRQLTTPAEQYAMRGTIRANEVEKLLLSTDNYVRPTNLSSYLTYLDFGGGNGQISSAVTDMLGIVDKNRAFSADIESWMSHEHIRNHSNVTYITVAEDMVMLPLKDNSISLITCFQVLHHIKNVDQVLDELTRVCSDTIIIREHDCQTDADRMTIDMEHSLFEMCKEDTFRVKYLNDYKAWYRSRNEWTDKFTKRGFSAISTGFKLRPSPTKYYYQVYQRD